MEIGGANKRGRPEVGLNGHGGFKKSKQEMESITSGIGSKLKPCTKFFSASGCPFGDGCHFLHYVPGGIKAVTQILGNNPALPSAPRNPMPPPPAPFQDGPGPGPGPGPVPAPFIKTRLCNKFKTAEGCKFGDQCHFAHGEWELGKPAAAAPPQPHDEPRRRFGGGGGNWADPGPPNPPAGFGALATAKISIDASLAGAVIGKGGVNSKQICRMTGAKLSVRDHETDANLRNIELEGSFEQMSEASRMVQELIVNIRAGAAGRGGGGGGFGNNYKTKICENFNKGSCTFGERCHFAHGQGELRRSAVL
ncbi:Zinc finger CCCH domain-containing protein 36 [Striga hermonthica]|uniref:Zinc finger CCCH domain-containing protein 36 n=1 Tax=Striga hermonthica TaxID=68872 RepID=A0A9N7R615_STRHE|nr:Zinc finger CCCH domain-containing protein 36 [Striga hermonthica]